ncbi:MAG: GNAT family N-acetyltransferase [Blastocatellia bacterium]
MSIEIGKAEPGSLNEVIALLARVNLPADGVAQHFSHFLVAREANHLVGCVGLEVYGDAALLRSLAVAPEYQKTGLGKRLTEGALDLARAQGVRDVVLLTLTAADFFRHSFEFAPVERAAYHEVFADSAEWRLPCCSPAVCLHLKIENE